MGRLGTQNSDNRAKEVQLKHVDIYCDGSCTGNPGVGGWGTILVYNNIEKCLHGTNSNTTNNQMEITAVIEGLKALKEQCDVTVYTDSQYVVNTMTKGWKRNKNIELWNLLDSLLKQHRVTFVWIKGHNGHEYNERCDKLARLR